MNFFISIVILLSLFLSLDAKEAEVKKVFGSSPPMTYLIYALNPKKMVGLNFSPTNKNNQALKEFVDPYFLSLPVIGTFHSTGGGINLESLLVRKPDLILVWEDDMMLSTVQNSIKRTKFPTLTIPFRKITSMPHSIEIAGEAMDESKRGKILGRYAQNIIDNVSTKLQGVKPVRYYYAEGVDGLATECDKSFHVEAMNFAGGENVHKCIQSNLRGLEQISLETLYKYDPEVIIAQNSFIYKNILSNPRFKNLDAVKNKRVLLVPNTPFNWVDRPPSFMRILGIQWLANSFHPKEYNINLNKQIKEFCKLFLHLNITDQQIKTILGEK